MEQKIIILVTRGDLVKNTVLKVREMSFQEKEHYYSPMIKSVQTCSYNFGQTPEENRQEIDNFLNAIQRKAYIPIKGKLKHMPFPMYEKEKTWDFLPEQKKLNL